MIRTVALCVLVGVLSLGNAPGQDKGAKKESMPSQEEMTKRWQEAMTPGEGHKVLEGLVGSWITTTSVWMEGPDRPPSVSSGTAECKWTLGKRFVQMDMTGEMMGMPMAGIGFTGYDNFKKKYINFWIDNTSTAMFTSEGTLSKDGKTMTMMGKMDEPSTGEKNKPVKYVDTFVGPDKHVFEIHDLSIKVGKTKVVEIVYERKK
jgi:hypothetical protein